MLAAAHRLRRAADFRRVLRRGRRAGGDLIVVHALRAADSSTIRFGLVVNKAVGNSVVRHQVHRRLRAVLAARIDLFEPGTDVVVRAMPPAGTARSVDFAGAVERSAMTLRGSAPGRTGRITGGRPPAAAAPVAAEPAPSPS